MKSRISSPPNANNSPQAVEGRSLWSYVRGGIHSVTQWTKNSVHAIAPFLIAAAPDHLAVDQNHAAPPNHATLQHHVQHSAKNDTKEHHGHESKELPKETKQRLDSNIASLLEMEKLNEEDMRKYVNRLPLLVRQDSLKGAVIDYDMGCIDDRQEKGKQQGVAGVGVLMNVEQHKVLVRSTVDDANRLSLRTKQNVRIRIRPHPECGAAGMAAAEGGKNPTPAEVEATAMRGANKTKDAIQQHIDGLSNSDPTIKNRLSVVVAPYDKKDMLPTDHPAAGVVINHRRGTVANLDRREGPILFNVSGLISPTAQSEAMVSALIAELSKHGKRGAGVTDNLKLTYKIIHMVDDMKNAKELEAGSVAALRTHPELGKMYDAGKIKILVVPPEQKAAPKEQSPRAKMMTSILRPKFVPNRSTRRHDEAIARRQNGENIAA